MTNIADLLTDNLDIWTSAIERRSTAGRGRSKKFSLYGIEKLRALILDLAVRGKLVAQDLSENVEPELTQLCRPKGQQKAEVNSSKEFSVPVNWLRAKFRTIFVLEYGDNLPDKARTQTGEFPVYGSNGVVGSHDSASVSEPCIVVGRKGSAGAINLCLADGCWVTDVAYSCIPPRGVTLHFATIIFRTAGLIELGKGIKPGLSRNEAYTLNVSVPPLAEQHRIVAKVDELMALCDRLEAGAYDAIAAHQLLVKELLSTLISSKNAEDFAQSWKRIETHFNTLFTTEDSIDQLKQTILQLAVMGKLVPQDANDEPAQDLLLSINAKRSALLDSDYPNGSEARVQKKKQSKQKLPKVLPVLPSGWKWATLMQCSLLVIDCKNKTAPYASEGIILIRTTNVRHGKINALEQKYVNDKTYRLWSLRAQPEAGDLIVTREAPMGEACIVPDGWKVCLGQRTMLARVIPELMDVNYLLLTFMSPDLMLRVQDKPLGMTVEHLRVGGVETVLIPVPPLAEQKRIVARMDELIGLCDSLKLQLLKAQNQQIQFADAVASRAVA